MKKLGLFLLFFGTVVCQDIEEPSFHFGMLMSFDLTNSSEVSGGYDNPQSYSYPLSFYVLPPKFPFGLYLDFSGADIDYKNCSNCYDLSVNYVENTLGDIRQEEAWTFSKTNIGIIYEIPKISTMTYVALGIGKKKYGYRYNDPFDILGDNGRYWIPANKSESINSSSFGLIYRFNLQDVGNILIKAGKESKPDAFLIGIGFEF